MAESTQGPLTWLKANVFDTSAVTESTVQLVEAPQHRAVAIEADVKSLKDPELQSR